MFGLILSIFAGSVSPITFWPLTIFGLGFFWLYIFNFLFFVYWIMMRKRLFIFPLAILILGFSTLSSIMQIKFFGREMPEAVEGETRFKVMSYNVRLFDLYNWSSNMETRKKIFDLLKEESPDVLCIQEFYTSDKGNFQNLDTIIKVQPAKNYHVEITKTMRKNDHWGIATFTTYPIVKKGKLDFGPNTHNIAIYTDVRINRDTIRIFNCHLQSIKFKPEDYKVMENLSVNNEEQQWEGTLKIFGKLKKAFQIRARQSDILKEAMDASPYPIILCGDFNDTPASYSYATLSKDLTDAFVKSGSGIGQSYAGAFPSFRIDYILHDQFMQSGSFRTLRLNLSDHYPIICEVGILPE